MSVSLRAPDRWVTADADARHGLLGFLCLNLLLDGAPIAVLRREVFVQRHPLRGQEVARNGTVPVHPYYWAAFELSGDWR